MIVSGSGVVTLSDCTFLSYCFLSLSFFPTFLSDLIPRSRKSSWDNANDGRYSIYATGTGGVIVRGNTFHMAGNQIFLDSGISQAVIAENMFQVGRRSAVSAKRRRLHRSHRFEGQAAVDHSYHQRPGWPECILLIATQLLGWRQNIREKKKHQVFYLIHSHCSAESTEVYRTMQVFLSLQLLRSAAGHALTQVILCCGQWASWHSRQQ
jgi:hypothetical protein